MRRFLHALLCLIGLATNGSAAEATPATYGTKVKFREGHALKFPTFELIYAGKRRVEGPHFPRGWWAHDFTVRNGGAEQKITWSSGTGDIGPTRFTARGATFDLELSLSDKLGRLKEDELVVTQAKRGN